MPAEGGYRIYIQGNNTVQAEIDNLRVWYLDQVTQGLAFVETIQAQITDRNPDFSEDFSAPSDYWDEDLSSMGRVGDNVADGVLRIEDDPTVPTDYDILRRQAHDFVLQFDANLYDFRYGTELLIQLQDALDPDEVIRFQLYETRAGWMGYEFHLIPEGESLGTGEFVQALDKHYEIQLIAANDQLALLINGELLDYFDAPAWAIQNYSLVFLSYKTLQVDIDNIRVWDLGEEVPGQAFVDSVQAQIAGRQPDFFEDFSTPTEYWETGIGETLQVEDMVSDGVFRVELNPTKQTSYTLLSGVASDFVLQFDFNPENFLQSRLEIDFRHQQASGQAGTLTLKDMGGGVWWFEISQHPEDLELSSGAVFRASDQPIKLQLVVSGNQFALVINDQLASYFEADTLIGDGYSIGLSAKYVKADIDNILIWNLEGVSLPTSTPTPELNDAHSLIYQQQLLEAAIIQLEISDQGTLAAVFEDGSVEVQDPGEDAARNLTDSSRAATTLTWVDDLLAITLEDGLVRVLDGANEYDNPWDLPELVGLGRITDLDFNPEAGLLIAATDGGQVAVWNQQTKPFRLITQFQACEGPIHAIDLHPESGFLTLCESEGLQIWTPDLGEQVFQGNVTSSSAVYSPDGIWIAIEDHDTSVFGAPRLEILLNGFTVTGRGLTDGAIIQKIVWAPDGSLVATLNDQGDIQFWYGFIGPGTSSTRPISVVYEIPEDIKITALVWGSEGPLYAGDTDGRVWGWEVDTALIIDPGSAGDFLLRSTPRRPGLHRRAP